MKRQRTEWNDRIKTTYVAVQTLGWNFILIFSLKSLKQKYACCIDLLIALESTQTDFNKEFCLSFCENKIAWWIDDIVFNMLTVIFTVIIATWVISLTYYMIDAVSFVIHGFYFA